MTNTIEMTVQTYNAMPAKYRRFVNGEYEVFMVQRGEWVRVVLKRA